LKLQHRTPPPSIGAQLNARTIRCGASPVGHGLPRDGGPGGSRAVGES
jgi:hypothetical protein